MGQFFKQELFTIENLLFLCFAIKDRFSYYIKGQKLCNKWSIRFRHIDEEGTDPLKLGVPDTASYIRG